MKKSILLFLCILLSTSFVPGKIRVFTIGDSTMANRQSWDSERGWGMLFPLFVTDDVQVLNQAINGYSTRRFITEGKWASVLDTLQEGDFVLIQFAHNDAKKDPSLHTDPATTYQENLAKFINESRARGGIPVLLTPIVRRNFDAYGNIADTHGAYPDAMRAVSGELNVPLIDMEVKTRLLENIAGTTGSRYIHQWNPESEIDNTHLCNYGAYVVARLVADGIREKNIRIPLKNHPETIPDAGANTMEMAYNLLSVCVREATETLHAFHSASGWSEFSVILSDLQEKINNRSYSTIEEMDTAIRFLRYSERAFRWTQPVPFDATFAIGNPSMEEGVIWDIPNNSVMACSWTLEASFAGVKELALKTGTDHGYYGFYIAGDEGASIDFFQDICLPAGCYSLKADLMPNASEAALLYAKTESATVRAQAPGSSDSWGATRLSFAVSDDNTNVRIGVQSSCAVMIDNFRILKIEDKISSH